MYGGGGANSYYAVLGVGEEASEEEIRRAYRRLAMQWHPDKWTRSSPSHLGEAKLKFQQIQEAYSVLSDKRKRMLYDEGLFDLDDVDNDEDEVEGFADFLEEIVSLMKDVRKQEKSYSIEELRSMFWEMAQGCEIPEWNNPLQQQFVYSSHPFGGMMGGSSSRHPHFNNSGFRGPFSGMMGGNSSLQTCMMQGSPHFNNSGWRGAYRVRQFPR